MLFHVYLNIVKNPDLYSLTCYCNKTTTTQCFRVVQTNYFLRHIVKTNTCATVMKLLTAFLSCRQMEMSCKSFLPVSETLTLVIYYTTYLYWLYITRLIYLDVDKCREGVWTWLTGSLINEGCQDRVVRKLWIVMDASTIIFRYSQCQAYET